MEKIVRDKRSNLQQQSHVPLLVCPLLLLFFFRACPFVREHLHYLCVYILTQPLTEKVDIYRMGLVFKKYLTGGGVHVVGTNGQDPIIPAFERVWHKIYKGVSLTLFDVSKPVGEQRPPPRVM